MTVRKRKWRDKNGRVQESWMIHIEHTHPDGRRQTIRRVSPVKTKRGAERYERELRQSLGDGLYKKEANTKAKPKVPMFEAFAEEFMTNYVEVNNKYSTIESKRSILKHHLTPFFGRMRLDAIGSREIERFKAAKLKTHAKKTVNNHLTTLRKLLCTAEEWGMLDRVPRVRWLKAETPDFRFLDFDEAERLLQAAEREPQWHAMILLALKTGMRHGELLALKWEDLDLNRGHLTVRRSVSNGVLGTPKSNRKRELPLAPSVVRTLKARRHLRGEFVFCEEDGSLLTRAQCKSPLTRARRHAGLRHFGWHDLRHTFASHLAMKGVPLKATQELLGHATIEMTMRYAHLAPSTLRTAVHCLDHPIPKPADANAAQHTGSTWLPQN